MILALLLSLPTLAGDPATDAPLVLRTYDLSGVLPRYPRFLGWEELFPSVRARENEPPMDWQEVEDPVPEMLIDLVQRQFPGEFDLEGRRLQIGEDYRLVVRAPEDVQQAVLKLAQSAESMFAVAGELFVDVVRGPRLAVGASAGVVAASEAEKLLAGAGGERSSYRVEYRPGVPALLDLTGMQAFLADYNVEIAQAASILDPIPATARTGVRIEACCAPAPGGSWIALTLRASATTGAPRDIALAFHGQITTQNETVRTAAPRSMQSIGLLDQSFAINAFLGEGKALVLRTGIDLADGKAETLVVLRTGSKPMPHEARLAPAGKAGAPEMRAFLMAYALPQSMRVEHRGLVGPRSEEGRVLPAILVDPTSAAVWIGPTRPAPDELIDLVRGENGDLDLRTWGPWLLAMRASEAGPAKPGELDFVDGLLARLGPSPRTFQLGFTLRRAGEKGAVLANAVLVARAGEPAVLVLGTERTRVCDYDVEVAQSASASDPTVEIAFEGLALEATPLPGLAGETRLGLRARGRVQRGTTREFQTGSMALGEIALDDDDQVVLDERLTFAKDGARLVRLGDTTGGSGGLVLEIELTEVR